MNAIRAIAILCVLGFMVVGAQAQEPKSTDEIVRLIEASEPGDVVVVPPGVYHGNLKVTAPIILDGQGLVTIDSGGEGTVVELFSPDITIRGFHLRGSGATVNREPAGIRAYEGSVVIEDNHLEDVFFGIELRESHNSVIRNNTIEGKDLKLGRRGDGIRLWWSHNCVVEGNTVNNTRDMVFWYSEDLAVSYNRVSNSRYGLHFMYSHNTVMIENELTKNSVGIYLMYSNNIHLKRNSIVNNRGSSGYGIGLKDCDDIIVEGNALLANRVGIYVDNSPSGVDSVGFIRDNKIAFNEIGILATPITHDNTISNNAFIENQEQVTVHGRGQLMLNSFSSDGTGNFWSNYGGFDSDNDGIGDFPYEPRSLFRTLLAREPNLRIFLHSPAQQAIELTARAFPELSPEPIFVDPVPLTRPPELNTLVQLHESSRTPMILFMIGLLFTSGVGGWLIARQQRFPVCSDSTPSGKAMA